MNSSFKVDDNTVFNPETGEFGYLPEILIFTTDKTTLIDETPATISWTVSNANLIKLNNEIVEATGSKTYFTTDLLEIELIASNDVGEADPRKIVIDINRTPPTISSFEIVEEIAIVGAPITLQWSVENATRVKLNNGIGDVTNQSSKKFKTTKDSSVFKLTAENYFGVSSEKEASIIVFPTPLIESIMIPVPNIEKEINLCLRFPKIPKIGLSINKINSALQIDSSISIKNINGFKRETEVPFVELEDDFDFIRMNNGYLKRILSNLKFKNYEVFKNIYRDNNL